MKLSKRACRFGVCLFTILFLPVLAAAQQGALTILHTNDTHGHLLPFSYPTMIPARSGAAAVSARTDIGGIARRATLVRQVRTELEARGTAVWLVDVGDFTDGSAFSVEYHGAADVAAMNAIGYTFATLGNHEFGRPLAALKRLIGQAQYPVLCANVMQVDSGQGLAGSSALHRVGPLTVGVFGLVTQEAAGYRAAKEGLRVAGEITTARDVVARLRREADIVVLLSHAGERTDREIAAAVPGIDVIVGGHSHTRLPAGAFVWASDMLKPKDVNGTIIVQAHQWGGELGRLDLLFEKDDSGVWHVSRYRARLLPITGAIPDDPAVAAVVASYWAPIAPRYGEVLAHATADFTDRGNDLAPYHLVADAVRIMLRTDIAVENLGGIRAPLLKGPITLAHLSEMDPFDNVMVTFRITGKQLKDLLLRHRPAVSGIRYRVENGQLLDVSVSGAPVDETRIYTGTANSFFARHLLQGIETVSTGKVRRDVVAEYLREHAIVRPTYDNRRVIVDR